MTNQFIVQIASHLLLLVLFTLIYFFIRKKLVYAITSLLIGITTYFLIFILSKNDFGIAAGLGLFAIFGIIRYRTEAVPILEMTYIFISITIAVIGSLSDGILFTLQFSLIINSILIVFSSSLFYLMNTKERSTMKIVLEELNWLKHDNPTRLQYLNEKSFQRVASYQIESIDWLKESCVVNIEFFKD